jgi:hypothetical protein
MEILDQALRGFLVGLLVALIVYYIFRPRQPYPRWILTPYDQPWMLVLLFGVVALMYPWDQRVAVLMVLLILGVGLDVLVFGKSYSRPTEPTEAAATASEEDSDVLGTRENYPYSILNGGDDAGPPLYAIVPPEYPLVNESHGHIPGSPAPF